MKLYVKLVGALAFTGAWLGVMIPGLVSASDDILVALGFTALAAYPVVMWKVFQSEIKSLKEKM